MINPKRLLVHLARLHEAQGERDNWPTVMFRDDQAIFSTHVSASGFREGVGFRFSVPVDRRTRRGVRPNDLPHGVFSVRERAINVLKRTVAKESDELLRLDLVKDGHPWANFRAGTGSPLDMQRTDDGPSYPLMDVGSREEMGSDVRKELFRLKEIVRLSTIHVDEATKRQKDTVCAPDNFNVVVRIGPEGSESVDQHRLVMRRAPCWHEDILLSGAHLQRAHDLFRGDPGARLFRVPGFVLLTGANWEFAMPTVELSPDYPSIRAVLESRSPATASLTIESEELVRFLAAGRQAAEALKGSDSAFAIVLSEGAYVPEYVSRFKTDFDGRHAVPHRRLPLWDRPAMGQSIQIPTPAGTPQVLGFNPTYLMDALHYLGARQVEVSIGTGEEAVVITAGDRLAVVMPILLESLALPAAREAVAF